MNLDISSFGVLVLYVDQVWLAITSGAVIQLVKLLKESFIGYVGRKKDFLVCVINRRLEKQIVKKNLAYSINCHHPLFSWAKVVPTSKILV